MAQVDVLRAIVARLGETTPDAVGPTFSLETAALKGSIKRAALAASIRRELGITCPSAHFVTSFAELEQAVFGKPATASRPVADASPATVVTAPVTVAPTFPMGVSALRCGVDIEAVSALPEANDFREHQFYQDAFAPAEIAYCIAQDDPRMHFAARWCVKEALYKCDPAYRQQPMADIELVRGVKGDLSLRQRQNGSTRPLPHAVSVSHTDSLAMAVVVMAPADAASGGQVAVAPPPSPAAPTSSGATGGSGGSLPLISALAWLVAIGVSILALVRTLN